MTAFLLALFAALSVSCSSAETQPESARPLLFPADDPAPTLVPPADSIDPTEADEAETSEAEAPPERLAFSDDSSDVINDLVSRLDTALDRPVTATFSGSGEEVLEIDGEAWRVVGPDRTPSNESSNAYTILGLGDSEWVTYAHVSAGALSSQAYAASTNGQTVEEMFAADPESSLIKKFELDRLVFEETASLESMWVPHNRRDRAFFTPSFLHRDFLDELLADLLAEVVKADAAGTLEIETTEQGLKITLPSSDPAFVTVARSGTQLTFTSKAGWMIVLEDGVADTTVLGAPDTRDILTRELLLASTQVPEPCVSPIIEAQALVEQGIVACVTPEELESFTIELPQPNADE